MAGHDVNLERVRRVAWPCQGPSPVPPPPSRLKVRGSRLYDPSGGSIRLTGFNWVPKQSTGALELRDAAWSATLGSNVARIVGVLWKNRKAGKDRELWDCATEEPPHFFNDSCFVWLDELVEAATRSGQWVILAMRSKYGAGQDWRDAPGDNVFRNATLRAQHHAVWRHVAAHYASFDGIAGYEVLAEPRDKNLTTQAVHDFYVSACAAAQGADPRTLCVVGTAPYYKLWTVSPSILMENPLVLYTFDYFTPDSFVFGRSMFRDGGYNREYTCTRGYYGGNPWARAEKTPDGIHT